MTSAHGSISRYTNDACRCIPCADANASYMRAYRRQKRTTPGRDSEGGSEARLSPGQKKDSQ